MPLPAPSLDNRKYRDMVNEMVARIPVHTPEWTNFGPSDPGITMIQLYAHIAENMIYRANQIPDLNRAKFLQLLGIGHRAYRLQRAALRAALAHALQGPQPRDHGAELAPLFRPRPHAAPRHDHGRWHHH